MVTPAWADSLSSSHSENSYSSEMTASSLERNATEPLLRDSETTYVQDEASRDGIDADLHDHARDSGDRNDELGNSHPKAEGTGKVVWPMMTFILLGDMFGLGTLTLPADFARLGWLPSLVIITVCLGGTLYSGRLFTLLAEKVPRARVFDDFGKAALGATGQRLVYVTVYGTILLNPIIFQLTSVESLQQVFYQHKLPAAVAGLIVVAIIIPLAQVKGLEDVATLSAIGTVGMVTAVAVAVGKLTTLAPPVERTELVHTPRSVNSLVVALLDIVFSYGGQVNWVRYITQMRVRQHFPRSAAVTTLVMTAAYIVMGTVGYLRLGPKFDHQKPITSVVPRDGVWTPLMNAGLFAHCILAYQINMNVWTDLVLHLLQPAFKWPESRVRQPGYLVWGVVSLSGIAISFVVAAIFPFFSTVAAIIASLGDLTGAYALPAIFLLALAGSSIAAWEKGLLRTIIPIALLLSAVGFVSSLVTLVEEFTRRLRQ